MARRPVQVAVTLEYRAEVSAHRLWNWGTTKFFDIRIVNLGAGSYLRMTPKKAIAKVKKYKKDLYVQVCLESRCYFTTMVYSVDGIPRAETISAHNRLAALLSFKLKKEYSELCGFV